MDILRLRYIVTTDGKDSHGLKLEKIEPTFPSFNSMPGLKGTKKRLVDRIDLKQHYRREIYSPFKTMFCKIFSFLYTTLHLN